MTLYAIETSMVLRLLSPTSDFLKKKQSGGSNRKKQRYKKFENHGWSCEGFVIRQTEDSLDLVEELQNVIKLD